MELVVLESDGLWTPRVLIVMHLRSLFVTAIISLVDIVNAQDTQRTTQDTQRTTQDTQRTTQDTQRTTQVLINLNKNALRYQQIAFNATMIVPQNITTREIFVPFLYDALQSLTQSQLDDGDRDAAAPAGSEGSLYSEAGQYAILGAFIAVRAPFDWHLIPFN